MRDSTPVPTVGIPAPAAAARPADGRYGAAATPGRSRRPAARTVPARVSTAVWRRIMGPCIGLVAAAFAACRSGQPAAPPREFATVPTSAILTPGDTLQITVAQSLPSLRVVPVREAFTWRVSDTSVATVTATGLLTARAPGLLSVTAVRGSTAVFMPLLVTAHRPTRGPLGAGPPPARYFTDPERQPVYLTGSHTWMDFEDGGPSWPPPRFDYDAFLDFLQRYNHNAFRLWRYEQATWLANIAGPWHFDPEPYRRTGPGNALDGRPRFDLTQFNDAYFARLRARVAEAGRRGIYVSIMLFNGWSVEPKLPRFPNPWDGHPFNRRNNVNGVDGDQNGDGSGRETHTLANPRITALQEEYVRRVVDAVSDLDNVLYEISNESDPSSTAWQYHMIQFLRRYEAAKGVHHPIGMTVTQPGGSNAALRESPADWVSPRRSSADPLEPPAGFFPQVTLYDTDHLCALCGSIAWVWKAFTHGLNPLFLDMYDQAPVTARSGSESIPFGDAEFEAIRRNLGYARVVAGAVDLAAAQPREELASSGYCLVAVAGSTRQYVAYAPDGHVLVDLRNAFGSLSVEWLAPETGKLWSDPPVAGGAVRSFAAPFDATRDGAVLLLNLR